MKGADLQTIMLQERAQHDRSILLRFAPWAGSILVVKSYVDTAT